MVPPAIIDIQNIRLRRPRSSEVAAVSDASDPEVAHYADWPTRTTIEPPIELFPDDDPAIGGIFSRVAPHAAAIGFLLNRRYWGRGIATNAARAVVGWALSVPEVWRVWAR